MKENLRDFTIHKDYFYFTLYLKNRPFSLKSQPALENLSFFPPDTINLCIVALSLKQYFLLIQFFLFHLKRNIRKLFWKINLRQYSFR